MMGIGVGVGVGVSLGVGGVGVGITVGVSVGVGDGVRAPSVSETGVAVEEAAICTVSLHTRVASR